MSARVDKLQRDLNKARAEIARTTNHVKRLSDDTSRSSKNIINSFSRMSIGATGFRTRLVATSRAMHAFLAIAAGGIATGFIARTVSATDALGKMASRLSISAEFLQEMRFAASQSGVTLQTLELGMQRIIRRAQDAAAGNKQLENAFFRVGLTVQDLRRLSNEEIFRQAIIGAARLRDGLFAIQQIADTEGVALINLGRAGASGLAALQTRARQLGLVLSNETVKAAEAANDRIDIMQRVLSVQLTRAILELSPHITRLGESFVRIVSALVDTNKGFHDLTANENQIVKTLKAIGNAAATAWGYLMQIGDVLGRLAVRFSMTGMSERLQQLNSEITQLQNNIDEIQRKQVGGPPQQGIFPGITIQEPGQNLTLMQNRLKNLLAEREVIKQEMARQASEGLLEGLRRAATQIEQQVRQISAATQAPKADGGFGIASTEAEANAAVNRLRRQQAEIKALNDQRLADEQEVANKFREIQNRLFSDMQSNAQQITAEFQLPVEAFNQQVQSLEDLRAASLITQGTFQRAMEAAKKAYEQTKGTIQLLTGVFTSIQSAFDQTVNSIIQGTQKMGEAFKNMFRNILLSVGSFLIQVGVWAAILAALQLIPGMTAVLRAADAAATASAAGSSAQGLLRQFSSQNQGQGSIQGLQHGGMVTSPTLAMLGENPANNPEYVLNKNQMGSLLTKEPTIILVDDRRRAEELAAMIPGAVIRTVSEGMLSGPSHPLNRAVRQGLRG